MACFYGISNNPAKKKIFHVEERGGLQCTWIEGVCNPIHKPRHIKVIFHGHTTNKL